MKYSKIFITTLLGIYSLLNCAQAQDSEEVVVTAKRLAQTKSSVLADVQVVSRKEIELHNAQTFGEALSLLPGVSFINYGGRGQTSSFYVRGSKAEHVLVLLDGQEINSISTMGTVNPNTIPANIIERIEFVRGQRATVYGSNAITGVINIITKPDYKNKQSLSYTYSTYNSHDFNTVNTIATENSVVKVAAGASSSDGYNVKPIDLNHGDKHGYKNKNLNLSYSHLFENDLELWGSYNYMNNKGDYDNSYDSAWGTNHEIDQNEVDRNMFSFGAKLNKEKYSFDLGLMYTNNNSYDAPKGAERYSYSSSAAKTNVFNAYFVNEYKAVDWLSVGLGVDYSNSILDKDSNTYASQYRDSDISLVNKGAALTLTSDTQYILAEGSARIDDNSIYGSEDSYTVGLGYKFIPNHIISARYGNANRAPTLSELYYPGYGNEKLKREKSRSFEMNFNGGVDHFGYYVNAYYNSYDNLIGSDSSTWQYINIAKAKIRGLELGATAKFEYIQAKLSVDLVEPKNSETNKTLTYKPKQQYKANIFGNYNSLDYSFLYSFTSKRYMSEWNSNYLGGYGVVNAGLGYTFWDKIRFGFNVNNLFDKQFEYQKGYVNDGRVWQGTIEIKNLF